MAGIGTRFGPTGGQSEPKKWGDTTSKAGEISRIFVGSIEFKTTSCEEIEQRFAKYGPISGIDLNQKNFAFIQYMTVDSAMAACANENGTFFRNKKIEVKLFDKSGHPIKGRAGGSQPPINRDRSRSPNRVSGGRPMGGPTGTRHGSMFAQNQYEDPYGYGAPPAPPPAEEPVVGNEAEIIVVNRDQWAYAEMIEKRIKAETGITYVDMLFLHSPTSLNVTLNDLFERQTYYALVVAPINEEHRSVTLHVIHNQTEHRNMPLEDAILLINKDFQAVTGHQRPPPSVVAKSTPSSESDNKLPEEVSYLLRTSLDNGCQFLTLTQLDVLIDYFQKEKTKLTARTVSQSTASAAFQVNSVRPVTPTSSQQSSADFEKQRASLFDNPHVQAALSSLIQIGALGSGNSSGQTSNTSTNNGLAVNSNPYGAQQTNNSSARRHPLLGTEVPPTSNRSNLNANIPGAPGGLVRYPLPQSYNQYSNYQF